MIRRPPTSISLGLDSLTDLMTNMMGSILLMVGITSVMSGGMRLTLLSHWANPGQREPLYLVCTADRIRERLGGKHHQEAGIGMGDAFQPDSRVDHGVGPGEERLLVQAHPLVVEDRGERSTSVQPGRTTG